MKIYTPPRMTRFHFHHRKYLLIDTASVILIIVLRTYYISLISIFQTKNFIHL